MTYNIIIYLGQVYSSKKELNSDVMRLDLSSFIKKQKVGRQTYENLIQFMFASAKFPE